MASLVRICHMVYDFQAGGFSPLINPTAINKSTKQWDSPYGDTHSLQGTTGCPTTILPCRKKSSPCTVLSLWVVELSFFEPLKVYLQLSKLFSILLDWQKVKVFWLKFPNMIKSWIMIQIRNMGLNRRISNFTSLFCFIYSQ